MEEAAEEAERTVQEVEEARPEEEPLQEEGFVEEAGRPGGALKGLVVVEDPQVDALEAAVEGEGFAEDCQYPWDLEVCLLPLGCECLLGGRLASALVVAEEVAGLPEAANKSPQNY